MNIGSILRSVAGYTRAETDNSADRSIRLAVIDPAYSGSGLPKVTFEGESVMSAKGYSFAESYFPTGMDRVVMLPVGNTYLIAGAVDDTTTNLVKRVAAMEGRPRGFVAEVTANANSAGTTSATFVDVAGMTFNASVFSGRAYKLELSYRGTQSSVANDVAVLALVAGGVVLTDVFGPPLPTVNSARGGGSIFATHRPGFTGTVTYKVQIRRGAGSGSVLLAAQPNAIATLLLTDVGPI